MAKVKVGTKVIYNWWEWKIVGWRYDRKKDMQVFSVEIPESELTVKVNQRRDPNRERPKSVANIIDIPDIKNIEWPISIKSRYDIDKFNTTLWYFTKREQEIIILRFISRFNYIKIWELFDLNPSTARQKTKKVLRRINELLLDNPRAISIPQNWKK